jgi:hypothetical protein
MQLLGPDPTISSFTWIHISFLSCAAKATLKYLAKISRRGIFYKVAELSHPILKINTYLIGKKHLP